MDGLLHREIDEHGYFSRRDAKPQQIYIYAETQRLAKNELRRQKLEFTINADPIGVKYW